MKKIVNFDKVEASTGFKNNRIPAGGYVVACTAVEDVPDKEYLRVQFDVCEGEHKLFFKKVYDADTRETKYWPKGGGMIRSYKQSAVAMFKGFTTAVEESNKGFKWDFDEKKLINKKFGVVIGDEEYLGNNGKVYVRNYVQAVRSVDMIHNGNFTVPELKKLQQTVTTETHDEYNNPFAEETPTQAAVEADTQFDDGENPFL